MDFDINKAKLVFEVKYFDNGCKNNCTHEYLYKKSDNTYFLHFVPGRITDNIIKNSYYELFEGKEGFCCIDELVVYAYKKRNSYKARVYFEEVEVIDWVILRRAI